MECVYKSLRLLGLSISCLNTSREAYEMMEERLHGVSTKSNVYGSHGCGFASLQKLSERVVMFGSFGLLCPRNCIFSFPPFDFSREVRNGKMRLHGMSTKKIECAIMVVLLLLSGISKKDRNSHHE
jgi:hypothetical protein